MIFKEKLSFKEEVQLIFMFISFIFTLKGARFNQLIGKRCEIPIKIEKGGTDNYGCYARRSKIITYMTI